VQTAIGLDLYVRGNTEDGLLCLLSFYYELGTNILGKLSSHIAKIFKTQKCTIRIITECRSRLTQRFQNLKILPLLSQYILSLLLLVVNNKSKLKLKYYVYNINSRQKHNFYQPSWNYHLYPKGVYSIGITLFKSLPQSIIKVVTPNN